MPQFPRQSVVVSFSLAFILFSIIFSPLIAPVISKVIEPYWDGACEECHSGFEPFSITPDSPSEVPDGEEFDYKLIIENPWTHELRNVQVTIDLSGAPNLMGIEAGGETEITENHDGNLGAGSSISGNLEITPASQEILIQMYYVDPLLFIGDVNLRLEGPGGSVWTSDLSDTTEVIQVGREDILSEGYGTYSWTLTSEAPVRSVEYHLTTTVVLSGNTLLVSNVDEIGSTSKETVGFRLSTGGRGENNIAYTVSAEAYHEHSGSGTDSDIYDEQGETSVTVGDVYSYKEPGSSISTAQALWYIGRVMAFVTTILFVLSFVSGGSMPSVRKWVDKRFKNRVKIHCNVSKLVILSAIVHLIVLYTGYYSGTGKGLVLGGIMLVLMIVLGATGAFKSKMAERIGEKNWSRIHFWISIIVLVIIIIHAVKEGTDLAFLRFWN